MMNILLSIFMLLAVTGSSFFNKPSADYENQIIFTPGTAKPKDTLLTIIVSKDNKKVTIKAPKSSGFKLPDSTAEINVFKNVDFNADGKKDLMLSLGACGTGGCMYGLFLKQHNNQYSLAFMDYLKNADFKKDKKGILVIKSSEEIEAYNPSKLQVTVFKYQAKNQYYNLDTTYVFIDKF